MSLLLPVEGRVGAAAAALMGAARQAVVGALQVKLLEAEVRHLAGHLQAA